MAEEFGERRKTVKFIKGKVPPNYKMSETICIRKNAILDLLKVKAQFDTIVESLELMADKKFMKSYEKSKEQIKKRDFADWNEL